MNSSSWQRRPDVVRVFKAKMKQNGGSGGEGYSFKVNLKSGWMGGGRVQFKNRNAPKLWTLVKYIQRIFFISAL